jgi:hypothetical protein
VNWFLTALLVLLLLYESPRLLEKICAASEQKLFVVNKKSVPMGCEAKIQANKRESMVLSYLEI